MQETLGFAHFLAQADALSKGLFAVLLAMSVASWYVIVTRTIGNFVDARRSSLFIERFWEAESLAGLVQAADREGAANACSRVAAEALAAKAHYTRGAARIAGAVGEDEFVTRTIRRRLNAEASRRERGLTLLASIGATAPFVGLFGTVWGVYGALIAIGVSGQGTLDKVAGPVGEALIMTAAGLAVAIPAVLGYNFFTRANREFAVDLDGFAHDLFALLSTGGRVELDTPPVAVPITAARAAGRS